MHYYGKADRSEDIFDFEPTDDEDDQQSPQDAVQPLKKKSKKARRRTAVGQQPGAVQGLWQMLYDIGRSEDAAVR